MEPQKPESPRKQWWDCEGAFGLSDGNESMHLSQYRHINIHTTSNPSVGRMTPNIMVMEDDLNKHHSIEIHSLRSNFQANFNELVLTGNVASHRKHHCFIPKAAWPLPNPSVLVSTATSDISEIWGWSRFGTVKCTFSPRPLYILAPHMFVEFRYQSRF